MTGWGAVVLVMGELAVLCFIWLIIVVTQLIREQAPDRVWQSAAVLANVAPDLVAEVAEATDPAPLLEHVVSIDTLPHAVLVEKVLTAEQREIELVDQIEDVRTEAIALIADVMIDRDAEHHEAVRQARAKKRHWSTIRRLKGNA